jgi:hypothetical protein
VKGDSNKKVVKVEIPLTSHTGKIRIKERRSYTDFGISVATRQKAFNKNMYVEWQIGYDAPFGSGTSLLDDEKFVFTKEQGGREVKKVPYELGELLFYFSKFGDIRKSEIDDIISFARSLGEENLLENRYRIFKSNPIERKINGFSFLESQILYPHLVYDFNNGFSVIAEITIKEKQKAVGIQPMLYICFPVSCLKDEEEKSLIGRTARSKETATLELTKEHAFIVRDTFKIFAMLSKSHREDVVKICSVIKKNL